jgi:hypothetical protein
VAVGIEGITFTLDEATELAERTRRYVGASPTALTPGTALAVQVEQRVAEGGGTVERGLRLRGSNCTRTRRR